MAGERTVKIKFTGETKGLAGAAGRASRTMKKFGKDVEDTEKGLFGKFGQTFKNMGGMLSKGLNTFSEMLPGAVGRAMEALPPQGQALAVALTAGLVTFLAPALGAAISSAVLLAVGGGVLAGGIALVAKSPKVKSAFSKFKDNLFDTDLSDLEKKVTAAQARLDKATFLNSEKAIKAAKYDLQLAKAELAKAAISNTFNKSLRDLAEPFIEPLVRAAQTFDAAVTKLKPSIGRLFSMMAPVIDKLAPGLALFFETLMPGLLSATEASIPLFETLAMHLPLIGYALTRFFHAIAAGGPGANQFFSDLLYTVEGLIISLGYLVAGLSIMYNAMRNAGEIVKRVFVEMKVAALDTFADILDGAIATFQWLNPGLGLLLKIARGKLEKFRVDANKELQGIKDKNVTITAFSNVGTVASNVARMLARIPSTKRINIQVYSNIGSVAAQVASTLARIPRRASGGPTSAGRSYLVGERGPEVLTMGSRNGNITPNRELDNGGDTYEIHVHLADGVKEVIRAEQRNLKRRAVARGAQA